MKYDDLPRDESGGILPLEAEFPVEFPLATPFEADGATVSRLSIREPNVGDIEIANREKTGLARMLRMLSLVAEISPEALRRVATRDYVRLQGLLEVFL